MPSNPLDNFGTVVGENPDCLLLSGTVVGENPDHVCWEVFDIPPKRAKHNFQWQIINLKQLHNW